MFALLNKSFSSDEDMSLKDFQAIVKEIIKARFKK